ncbi:hypothetical protein IV203_026635 [Nitzschia inconspicua]|uniref:Uncharacterized protein n=1 Tax=Nitzschia inconspicua TaxID=303405 RepID=A0A9K3LIZ0_9STRA|nr:hypothetical protein IV203_026635 [Nitzschia inconspicua]
MVEISQPAPFLEDEHIPLVEAVYIDSELTEVHPYNVIVDAFEMQGDASLIAAVANEVSPTTRRSSSCCSCVSNGSSSASHGRHHSLPEEEDATSLNSRISFQEADHLQDRRFMDHSLHPAVSLEEDNDNDNQVFGAGAAGAVLGLLMGGPFLCIILGLGSFVCSQQEGAVGDIARAMGDVALLTQSKFQELNEKHHLVDKGKEAAGKVLVHIKAANERHRQRRYRRGFEKKVKFRKLVAWCWKSLLDFERKHKILGGLSQKAKEHLDALVEQYLPNDDPVNPRNQSSNNPSQQ